MTDAEIEQERKSMEPPLAPLYVDKLADERNREHIRDLVNGGVIPWHPEWGDLDEVMTVDFPYAPDGSITRPFLTVEEAREVQKPGQSIVVAGYATIGAAPRKEPVIPQEIKERCS